MNILIAGASGFVGHELINALKVNHHVTTLGRKKTRLAGDSSNNIAHASWSELSTLNANDFDAVINLCGSNISASRWNEKIKTEIIDSRVKTSTLLIDWIIKQNAKPHFMCANAVGIYGLQSNHDRIAFDENTPINSEHPHDYLSEIGIRWQEALQPAINYGLHVTTLRFGVVLKKNGGMLKKLLPSFYFGMGSILGDGKQTISWVHMDDVLSAIIFLLNKPELTGAFNITSPNPVDQAQFARELASSLHRPLFLTLPAFVIRAIFGEMGECLLLKGQRVLPKRLIDAGFTFHHATLSDALNHEFN